MREESYISALEPLRIFYDKHKNTKIRFQANKETMDFLMKMWEVIVEVEKRLQQAKD